MKIKRLLFFIVGTIFLGLGILGAILPILPTVPFILLASVCYAKSSEKLHSYFINTKFYKKNIESYANGNGMSVAAKVRIITTVTVLMGFGFTIMFLKHIYIPCLILFVVWLFHIIYFVFFVKNSN